MIQRLAALLVCALIVLAAVSERACAEDAPEKVWRFGFGRRQILYPEAMIDKLYIAGYHNDLHVSEVLDWCEARAVWLDDGGEGILLIGIDCVAVDSGFVSSVREALSDIPSCRAINVYATHDHAGPDTLGLWGPVLGDGKDPVYMRAVFEAACAAAREAAAQTHPAALYYGAARTENMCRDSRTPVVYDDTLYQLRFEALDDAPGLRMLFFGAHAESLRGDNTRLSRDYPGLLCDGVTEATGDQAIFMPGAVGGLIMTREFTAMPSGAVENLHITADKLVGYALSIAPADERLIAPGYALRREVFTVPLENPAFLMYKTLGILNNRAVPADGPLGFAVETELTLVKMDGLTIAMLPGELFPELVTGEAYGRANPDGVNPDPLNEIAARHGLGDLLIIGLCNDELGYIVPPSDFLVNEAAPYIQRVVDGRGEDHYEETNSVGPACAPRLAQAFEKAAESFDP